MGAVLLLAISLALHAEPPRLILGERSRVELEIVAPGAPADARLELWTSAGRIVEVRREKGDLFRAVYQRPKERFPRVALLLAKLHAYGVEDRAWLALPLIASEKLPVHTKPGSRVELRIGEVVFGPVVADAAGNAKVPVKIPPGQGTARVRVRDPFGNVNETSVDLRPPPFPRIRILAVEDRASWANPPARLEIFAVLPDGQPAQASDLVLSADRGTLGQAVTKAPGLFEVPYQAPDKAGGAATIRVGLSGEAQKDTAAVAILPGPPARIRLTATPPEIAGAGEVRLAAEVQDGRGNPLNVQAIELSSDAGTVEAKGLTGVLRVPAAHEGRGEIRVTAKGFMVEGTLSVPLRPGPPASASIRLSHETVRDGEALDATVELRDAGGNLVPHAFLEVIAEGARAGAARELGEGLYAIAVLAEPADGPRTARLRVRSGKADEVARIDVVREESIRAVAVGAMLGGQSNLSRANAASLQAEVSAHAGPRPLELVARAGFLQFATASQTVSGVPQRGELRGLSVAAGVRASAPLGPFAIHGTLLGGMLRSFGSIIVESGPAAGVRQGIAEWGPCASALLGTSMRAGRGRAVAELQLTYAPGHGDLAGNLGGIGVSLGYLYPLR
jgi:hypothetical protein